MLKNEKSITATITSHSTIHLANFSMAKITDKQLQDVADLLMAAALSDGHFHDKERGTLLKELAKAFDLDAIPQEISDTLSNFDENQFSLRSSAQSLRLLDQDAKRTVLKLIAHISIADGVLDLRENAFLLAAASAIEADKTLLGQLTDERVATLRLPDSN